MTEPWPNYVTTATLGPQPGPAMCCGSWRRIAQMLAHLLVANGYTQFAAELYTMLEEEEAS